MHAANIILEAADMRIIFSLAQEHAHSFCNSVSHQSISFISQSSFFKFTIINRLLVNCPISTGKIKIPIKNVQALPYAVITFSKWRICVLFWCVLLACLVSSSQAAIIVHRLNFSSGGLTLRHKQVSDFGGTLSINRNARSAHQKMYEGHSESNETELISLAF